MLELSTAVQYVKGIGPRIAEILAAKGIHTVDDLLHYLPFRYEDRVNPRGISELRAGEMATVIAEVRTSGLFRTRRMPISQMTAGQGRSRLRCIWFNATYLKDKFQPGQMVALYGKVEDNKGELELRQPQFEIIGEGEEEAEQKVAQSLEIGRIVPIYESAGQGRLTSRWFRRAIHGALENLTPELPEAIPSAVRKRLDLLPPRQALQKVHWPDEGESIRDLQASRTRAHIRMIFEELFFIELGLELKRRERIVALKNVTINEPFFNGHFPGLPIMPGVLVVEAIAQAGGALLLTEVEDRTDKVIVFTGIERARFRRPVSPGDQLRLEVQVTGWRPSARMIAAKMYGQALVNGKKVAEATVSCQLIDSSRGRGGEDQATE